MKKRLLSWTAALVLAVSVCAPVLAAGPAAQMSVRYTSPEIYSEVAVIPHADGTEDRFVSFTEAVRVVREGETIEVRRTPVSFDNPVVTEPKSFIVARSENSAVVLNALPAILPGRTIDGHPLGCETQRLNNNSVQYRFYQLNNPTPVFAEPDTPEFLDVTEGTEYADAIQWAVDEGITTGVTKTMFHPHDVCTRAQAVTFLWRAAGSPEPASLDCPFKDLDPDDFYYEAVLWASQNGIAYGMTTTTFHPLGEVTRGQAVTFLYRYRGAKAVQNGADVFYDVEQDDYFAEPSGWAVVNGIAQGVGTTEELAFGPDVACSRAQFVTFLYRDHLNNP